MRHALVDGRLAVRDPTTTRSTRSTARTARCARELGEVEERTRRRDILVDDEAVVEFYDRRIPADVTDVRRLRDAGGRRRSATTPDLLTMTRADLLDEPDADARRSTQFPDRLGAGRPAAARCAIASSPARRTTASPSRCRSPLLAQLRPDGFDWLVPGLREELVTALLKALPKAIRKQRRAGGRLGAPAARRAGRGTGGRRR